MAKKKGRSGGGAKRGRGGGSRSRQQANNNNAQHQQSNNGGHKVHQNQFLQQQRRLQMQRNSRCRLFYLQQHLILKVFNFLDQEGRESAFKVMGWSMESHQRRKEEMQRQRQIMEKVKERNDWKKDIFKNVLDAEDTRNKNNANLDDSDLLCNNVDKNMVISSNDFAYPDETQDECETREKLHDILPPLFARVDADTLLARLNTRRLYQRLCHYKREDARKLAEHIAKYSSKDGTFDGNDNGDDGGGETTIVEMFEGDLRNETTANRIYPKNLTIAQMAEKEWDDLMVSMSFVLLFVGFYTTVVCSSFYSPKVWCI